MQEIAKQGVSVLLRSALSGEKLPLPEGFTLEGAYSIIRRHRIMSMCYCGACNCGIDESLPVMQKLQSQTYAELIRGECQEWELSRLKTEFKKANIDFLPVKGLFIKKLYSQPHMRYMADADILIKPEQRETIEQLLSSLGYHKYAESLCEIIYENDNLHLELHKWLIPPDIKDYFCYFKAAFDRAEQVDGSEYKMRDEDHFIYVFVHFARHYRGGGIGLKHLCDLFVCREGLTLDEEYLKSELEKLSLLEFYLNVSSALDAFFLEGEKNDVSELIIDTVFESGAYGTAKSVRLSDAARRAGDKGVRKARRSHLLWTLFLPYSIMCIKYPVLKKVPFLLPFLWAWRIIAAPFKGRSKALEGLREVHDLSANEIREFAEKLNAVGLKFDF